MCELVTENPVLNYYDINENVTIECNASKVSLDATLLQNGQLVAYASRYLISSKQRYSQIKRECLAIGLRVKNSDIIF